MHKNQDNSEGMKYVKSIKEATKRRYASEYLTWIRTGRAGVVPVRGGLSAPTAKAVALNLDALG